MKLKQLFPKHVDNLDEVALKLIYKFLHNLQNLAPLFIGSSQYGHIKAVILTGGKSLKCPL